MKTRLPSIVFPLVLLAARMLPAEPFLPPPLAAEEFAARRSRVLEAMERGSGKDAVLLLRAPLPDHFSGDVEYPYRPDNDLFYLTGIERADCALLLSVREIEERGRAVLFFKPVPDHARIWIGEGLTRGEASELSGLPAAQILALDDLDGVLARALPEPGGFHAPVALEPAPLYFDAGASFVPGAHPTEPYDFLLEALGSRAFHLALRPPREILHPLRQVKSAAEISHLEKAIDATCKALVRAIRSLRPGAFEFEARALIESTFVAEGCRGWGFPSIIASGPNTCILHYMGDRRRALEGELFLMDIGAEYGFYSADITRTVPVSGRFSARQRQVYEVVLEAQERTIAIVRPGITLKDVNDAARRAVAAGLERLGIIEAESQVGTYLLHGVTHGLGLDVHDPMPIRELAPGMVITVEPGVYIPGESLGIRIEDDILVTEDGGRVLSTAVPKKVEEIEALMAERAF
jgi:Xaa-Pro aminopeptidase